MAVAARIRLFVRLRQARERREPRVAPRLHVHPRAHLGGPVRRGLDGGDPGREALAVIDVLDEGQQQCRAIWEVQVERLAGDARRAGHLGHRRHGVAPSLEQPPGRVEDSPART
jgi:hypothetical protein